MELANEENESEAELNMFKNEFYKYHLNNCYPTYNQIADISTFS